MNEKELIELFRRGDEKSFKTLFYIHYESLCAYAYSLLRDKDEAEELVQDLFCNIWEKREQMNIESSVKSYLTRSVKNRAFNKFRHQKVKSDYAKELPDLIQSESGLEKLEVAELEMKLGASLAKLPELSLKIFNMSREESMTYAQIAEKLGISVKTVEAYITKALKQLRADLSEYLVPFLLILLDYYLLHRVMADSGVI